MLLSKWSPGAEIGPYLADSGRCSGFPHGPDKSSTASDRDMESRAARAYHGWACEERKREVASDASL